MRRTLYRSPVALLLVLALLCVALGFDAEPASAKDEATRGLRYPSLSADGKHVTFAYRGDIWVAGTGPNPQILRLTIHEAQDTLPRFSPDGKQIAFASQREGGYDIFTIPVDGGVPTRITFHSGTAIPSAWSPDGKFLLVLSDRDATARGMDAYEVPLAGGTPRRLTLDGGVREASYSKDGTHLVYVRGFNTIYQDNYEGSSNYDVWTIPLRKAGEDVPNPTRVTNTRGNERYPCFSADGKWIYVVAEEKGVANFYAVPVGEGERKRLTSFKGSDVHRPVLGYDYKTVVFEREGRLFTADLSADTPAAKGLDLVVKSDVRHSGVVSRSISNGTQQVHVSADGSKLAFAVRGDIWTMSANGGNAKRISSGPAIDEWPRWSPDGRRIAFQSDRSGNSDIWLMDANGAGVKQLTKSDKPDFFHNWSPDGQTLVFCSERSGNRDIWTIDVESGAASRITNHASADDDPTFSPDGRLIAFDSGREGQQAVYVMDVDGSNVRRVTSGSGFLQVPCFSPDGRFLAYEAFNPATGSSGGIFVISVGGGPTMQVSRDGSTACWSPRGDYIYFAAGPRGREGIFRVPAPEAIENRESVPFLGTVQVDTKKELEDLFEEAWRQLQRGFYDPKMHGVDWDAMKKKYRQMAIDAEVKEEFQNIVRQMLAELNASHLGIRGGTSPSNAVPDRAVPTGYLGAELDEQPTKSGGRKVSAITKGGPADKIGLRVGDEITALNKKRLGPTTNLDTVLAGTVGKEIEIRYRPITADGYGDERRSAELKPIASGQVRQMEYAEWATRNVKLVRDQSKGHLGYIHLTGMNPQNLQKFQKAIGAWARSKRVEGLVLDVRENGGGNIHQQLMQILMAKPYAFVRPRGSPMKIPQPALFWDKPVVVLCNERSFSDAEVFPHIFQAMGRGKVVGVPTPGGVIGTNDITLSDGTVLRIPHVGYYSVDGKNLEGSGVTPDIVVVETPEDRRADRDPQLLKAIEVVMAEVRAARTPTKPTTTKPDKPATPKPTTTPDATPEKPDTAKRTAGALDPLADVKQGEWVRYKVHVLSIETSIVLKVTITEVDSDSVVADPVVEEGPEIPFPLPRDWANRPLLETLVGLGGVAAHEVTKTR